MPNVTQIRAQFGLTPAGDPYTGIYPSIAQRHLPPVPKVGAVLALSYQVFQRLFPEIVTLWMQNRLIGAGLGKTGILTVCSGPSIAVRPGSNALNIGIQGVGAAVGVASIALPALGPAGAVLGVAFSFLGRDNTAQLAVNSSQAACTISSTATQLITALDQGVGQGKITPSQARAVWDSYALQLKQIMGSSNGLPYIDVFYEFAIDAMGDFSENFLWPDLYPKPLVAIPAQPTMPTPTPAPANEVNQGIAIPPAAFMPGTPLAKPGSPRLVTAGTPYQSNAVLAPPSILSAIPLLILLTIGLLVILAI